MAEIDHPVIRRVSYNDQLRAAADAVPGGDRDRSARVLAAAQRLAPLHAIQVRLDGLARTAQDYRDGVPDPYGKPLSYHADEAAAHVAFHRDVLKAGYEAAVAMIAEMADQTTSLEKTMSANKPDVPEPQGHPQLTTDGSPHPLEEGGYDANKDPGLPGNISDVEALKEGKATRAQTEAIGKADAAEADGHTPAKADGSDRDEGDDREDEVDDKGAKTGKTKHKGKDKGGR